MALDGDDVFVDYTVGIDIAHHSLFIYIGNHDLDWRRGPPLRDVGDNRRCLTAGCEHAGSIFYVATHVTRAHRSTSPTEKCITCASARYAVRNHSYTRIAMSKEEQLKRCSGSASTWEEKSMSTCRHADCDRVLTAEHRVLFKGKTASWTCNHFADNIKMSG